VTIRAIRLTEQALKTRRNQQRAETLARAFVELCRQRGLPVPEREHRFAAPDRQWRFDFAFIAQRIALEVEGGIYVNGRHTRAQGFVKDVEKYNAAALRGWRVFRTMPAQLCSDETLTLIAEALRQ